MNLEEFEVELEDVLTEGTFSIVADSHGQIIIYTGLMQDDDGNLVEYVNDEEDDDDEEEDEEDFDSDFVPYSEDD